MANLSREKKLVLRIMEHCKQKGITAHDLSILTKLEPKLTQQLLSGDVTLVGFYQLKEVADALGISYSDIA